MATISSLGIGSGLDLSSLLDQLKSAEQEKLSPIVSQQSSYKAKLSAFGQLESSLDKLQTAAAALNKAETFQAVTSSITGDAVTASAGSEAVPGRYEVSVTQLAKAQSLASQGVADKTASIGQGTLDFTIGEGDSASSFTVTVDESNDSLEGLRDAINAKEAGVTASIVNDGDPANPYRLVLTSDETGTESQITAISAGADSDVELSTKFSYPETTDGSSTTGMSETVTAQNAMLAVNGIEITSPSNTVKDAIQGVTLDLSSVTGAESEILTVSRDNAAIKKAVTSFVSAYNSLQSTTSSLSSYDAESETAGTLLGNSTLRGVESRLRNVMSGAGEGEIQMLSQLGVTLQLDGTLKVDDEDLDEAISTNLSAVSEFFTGADGKGGFATRLDESLETMLGDKGLIKNATDGIDATLERLGDRYTRMGETIDATVARYRTQFAQLDSLVSQMNSTSSYLTQQFDAMNAQLNQ
ncbi:flagellar filament capping protein FliD [Halomonas sp. WWR20]